MKSRPTTPTPQNGLAKQRMIQQVMERIVTQTIPQVGDRQSRRGLESLHQRSDTAAAAKDADSLTADRQRSATPASLTRATPCCRRPSPPRRKADPYSPTAPTLIARRFDEDREIPEARVQSHAGAGADFAAGRADRRS